MAPPRIPLQIFNGNIVVIGERKQRGRVYWRIEGPHPLFPRATLIHYTFGKPVFEIQRARVIMAAHLGRPLEADEIVHHKNSRKSDDDIENLELTNQGEHNRHHKTGMKHSHETREQTSRTLKELYYNGIRKVVTRISERDSQGRIIAVEKL